MSVRDVFGPACLSTMLSVSIHTEAKTCFIYLFIDGFLWLYNIPLCVCANFAARSSTGGQLGDKIVLIS